MAVGFMSSGVDGPGACPICGKSGATRFSPFCSRRCADLDLGRWLKGVFPVSTGIVVSALARPEWLVEIDVIAVIPAKA